MKIATLKTLLMTMRPPFLVLTFSIMLLLMALGIQQTELIGKPFSLDLFVLAAIGALAAHIGVNMLNEYEDFHSGLDSMTSRIPFSGGSGALQANHTAQEWVAGIGYGLIGLLLSLGGYFIYVRGWSILPIGLLGVGVVLTYTSVLTRFPWLCFIASGLGFGPLMMQGAYFVSVGSFSWAVFWVSLIPFLLVNNLLLINQLPDKIADEKVGRFNIWHRYGLVFGLKLFLVQGMLSFLLLALLLIFGILPMGSALGFGLLLLFVPMLLKVKYLMRNNLIEGASLNEASLRVLQPVMGMNVGITILLPILIAVGIYLSLM